MSSDRTLSTSIDIDAPPARVFPIMFDVERWPEWTASISHVERLDPGPLHPGSRTRIRQPRFPPALWVVTRVSDGRDFTWESSSPGLRVVAHHRVEPIAAGTRATLAIEFGGLLGGLWMRLTRGITLRYLGMEAQGLKARAEGRG